MNRTARRFSPRFSLVLFLAASLSLAACKRQESPGSAVAAPPIDIASLDFPPFELDRAALMAVWEAERADQRALSASGEALIEAWQQENFVLGANQQGVFEGDTFETRAALSRARRDFTVEHNNPADYLRLGWFAHALFSEGLDGIRAAARERNQTLSELLRNPDDPVVRAAYQGTGDFIAGALHAGVLSEDGELHVSGELLTIMFRARWMWDMRERYPLEMVLPGAEQRALDRWRLERAPLSLEARLEAIEHFEAEFGFREYPPSFARAVAFARAGDTQRAFAELALGEPTESGSAAGAEREPEAP